MFVAFLGITVLFPDVNKVCNFQSNFLILSVSFMTYCFFVITLLICIKTLYV